MAYRFLSNARFMIQGVGAGDAFNTIFEFVRLVKFLDNASVCGIQRIASNYGSNFTVSNSYTILSDKVLHGTGFEYETTRPGNNAWVLYKFNNAQVPFYLLIQHCSIEGTFGNSPGNPGSMSQTGIGVQIAMRSDGGNPWNGTTNNNGADTKGSPCWVKSTANKVYVFPRCNNTGGSYTTTKQRFTGIDYRHEPILMSAIVNENTFFFCSNRQYNSTEADRPSFLLFSKYTPIAGSNPTCPYFYLTSGVTSNARRAFTTYTGLGNLWGSTTASDSWVRDGGIITEISAYNNVAEVLTLSIEPMVYGGVFVAGASWNTWNRSPSDPTKMLEVPILLFANDAVYGQGLVGYSNDFLRYLSYPGPPFMTFNSGSRMSWEYNTTYPQQKFTTPWTGSLPPIGCYSSDRFSGFEDGD